MPQQQQYSVQGGMKNYAPADGGVVGQVPRRWQSRPGQPETMLAYITDAEADVLRDANVHGKDDPSKMGTVNIGPAGVPSFDDTGGMSEGTTGGGGMDEYEFDEAVSRMSVNPLGIMTTGGGIVPSFQGADANLNIPSNIHGLEAQLPTQTASSYEPPSWYDALMPNTAAGWAALLLAPATFGGSAALTGVSRGLSAFDLGYGLMNQKGDLGTIPGMSLTPSGSMTGGGVGKGRRGTQDLRSGGADNKENRSEDPWLPPRLPLAPDPTATVPVAAAPQLMAAPTPTVMGTPIGYDPTTAGRTYTDFTRTAQRGGLMDLQHQAHNVAAQGRGGDSMLVHMRPDEVAGLQALGGVTRNPQTGLPEHFLGSILGGLGGMALAPFTGGMSAYPWLFSGLGSGLGQFAESKMRGDENAIEKGLTSGLMAGLGSWGLGKLGAGSAADYKTAVADATKLGKAIPSQPFMSQMVDYFPQSVGTGMKGLTAMGAEPFVGAAGMGLGSGAVTDMMMPYFPEQETGEFKSTAELTPRYRRTARDLSEEDLTRYGMGPEGRFFSTQRLQGGGLAEAGAVMEKGEMLLPPGTGDYHFYNNPATPMQSQNARDAYYGGGYPGPSFLASDPNLFSALPFMGRSPSERQTAPDYSTGDVVAEEITAQAVSAVRGDHPEPEKAIGEYIEMFGEESFGRLREMVIQEMQVESAGGREEVEAEGMISGPGAGRDDLIRGSIEGEEELRVSDGEFIVPADVVSGIGDGSSDAGAKRLYAMLDRVRQTRTGTNKQPSRVDEQEMLPA